MRSYAATVQKADREVGLEAAKQNGSRSMLDATPKHSTQEEALKHAAPEHKANCEVVLEAVRRIECAPTGATAEAGEAVRNAIAACRRLREKAVLRRQAIGEADYGNNGPGLLHAAPQDDEELSLAVGKHKADDAIVLEDVNLQQKDLSPSAAPQHMRTV